MLTPASIASEYKQIEQLFFTAVSNIAGYWALPVHSVGNAVRAKFKDGVLLIEIWSDTNNGWVEWKFATLGERCIALGQVDEILTGLENDGRRRFEALTKAKSVLENWQPPNRVKGP